MRSFKSLLGLLAPHAARASHPLTNAAAFAILLCWYVAEKLALPSPAGWVPLGLSATPAASTSPKLGKALSGLPTGLLRRSGSVGSLNSMVSLVDAVTGEQQLRICRHCDQVGAGGAAL